MWNELTFYTGIVLPILGLISAPFAAHKYIRYMVQNMLSPTEQKVEVLEAEVKTFASTYVTRPEHDTAFDHVKSDLNDIKESQKTMTTRLDSIFLKLSEK